MRKRGTRNRAVKQNDKKLSQVFAFTATATARRSLGKEEREVNPARGATREERMMLRARVHRSI